MALPPQVPAQSRSSFGVSPVFPPEQTPHSSYPASPLRSPLQSTNSISPVILSVFPNSDVRSALQEKGLKPQLSNNPSIVRLEVYPAVVVPPPGSVGEIACSSNEPSKIIFFIVIPAPEKPIGKLSKSSDSVTLATISI